MNTKVKRLLLITFGFPPWGGPAAIRASRICEFGMDQGWEVTVLCADQNCAHVFADKNSTQPNIECLRVSDGTDYPLRRKLINSIGYRGTRLVDRVLRTGMKRWNRLAINRAIRHYETPPDIICSTSPPLEISATASHLAEKWRVPWIADFRDPPWENMHDAHEFGQMLAQCHTFALNTPLATKYVKENWPSFESKIITSTNAIDAHQIASPPAAPLTQGVIYAGGLYPCVVETIERVSQSLPVHVYAFREAKRRSQHQALERLPNVFLHEPVSGEEYVRLLRSHTAVLIEHPASYQYRIPIKTYSAVVSGRPILLSGTSNSTRLILQDIPGVFVLDPDQPRLLSDECWRQIKQWDASQKWTQRECWAKQHTWDVQLAKLFSNLP